MAEISGEYNINLDTNKLQASAGDLSGFNQTLSNNITSIKYITNSIRSNWTNESIASDVTQSLTKIDECIQKLESVVFPVLNQYVETMINLSVATDATADKTIDK